MMFTIINSNSNELYNYYKKKQVQELMYYIFKNKREWKTLGISSESTW